MADNENQIRKKEKKIENENPIRKQKSNQKIKMQFEVENKRPWKNGQKSS